MSYVAGLPRSVIPGAEVFESLPTAYAESICQIRNTAVMTSTLRPTSLLPDYGGLMAPQSNDEFATILKTWSDRVSNELKLPANLDDIAIQQILGLAGVAAHGVLRPAAPLTTFLAGIAIGADPSLDLAGLAARITALIEPAQS